MTGIINKPLLLHLVGCLYYLYQWCTVKQISDNEIYLLIKYIKSVLGRVAKCLSNIEEARCLKVKTWMPICVKYNNRQFPMRSILFYSIPFYSILLCYQPYCTIATECIFRNLLIIRTSVITQCDSNFNVRSWNLLSFSTLHLLVPIIFLSKHRHYTSYLTCHIFPNIYVACSKAYDVIFFRGK